MSILQVVVVGGGHLGRIHARLLAEHRQASLIAIVEPNPTVRQSLHADFNAPIFADCCELGSDLDAAIIAAPTAQHFELGKQLLTQGVHVLMEKPLTCSTQQADELNEIARRHHCMLQVGHVERFNPALQIARGQIESPKYIEARRLSAFSFRSMDIGVVFDLMIHDIDIILSLVEGDVVQVDALGSSVLGGHEDMAQARLTFDSGCVANLTASRTSYYPERTMSIFSASGYAKIDFAAHTVETVRPAAALREGAFDATTTTAAQQSHLREHLFETLLPRQTHDVPASNPILEEQRDFIRAIKTRQPPLVSGVQGREAVAVAERVMAAINAHCWNGSQTGPLGPHGLVRPTLLQTPLASTQTSPPQRRRKAG